MGMNQVVVSGNPVESVVRSEYGFEDCTFERQLLAGFGLTQWH